MKNLKAVCTGSLLIALAFSTSQSFAGEKTKRSPSDVCQSSIAILPPCAAFALDIATAINSKNSGDLGAGACSGMASSKPFDKSKITSFQISFNQPEGTDSKDPITYSIVTHFERGGSNGGTCTVTATRLCDNTGCDKKVE